MLLSYKIFGHISCKLKDYIGTHKKKKKKKKKTILGCVYIVIPYNLFWKRNHYIGILFTLSILLH